MLKLIDEKKYAQVRRELADMNVVDIAEFITEELEEDSRIVVVFRLLPKEKAADVISHLDHDVQQEIVEGISDRELALIVDDLYLDDTVDFLEELPANLVKRVLKAADSETRKQINQLLMYPEDSAGSIMTTEFMELDGDWTVSRAISEVRRQSEDKETISTLFVTDGKRKLEGVISLRDVLVGKDDDLIMDLMENDVISVRTDEDQEVVAQTLAKYDLVAIPVTDKEGRLVGIVTVDDAIDVLQEEVTEDIEKMAAILPSEEPYLKTSVFDTWKARIPWLLLLMVSATFTGMIITGFEDALAAQVALSAFIPMLMDSGGNSGSQASVTIIRGISLDEIEFRDIFTVLWKEFRVSILCGVTLSAVSFLKILFVDGMLLGNSNITAMVALVVSSTLLFTVICAKLVGAVLPMLAKKIGFDPAVMASPFITTIVDAISLLIYFQVARMVLHI